MSFVFLRRMFCLHICSSTMRVTFAFLRKIFHPAKREPSGSLKFHAMSENYFALHLRTKEAIKFKTFSATNVVR